jgi:hypothetical protein
LGTLAGRNRRRLSTGAVGATIERTQEPPITLWATAKAGKSGSNRLTGGANGIRTLGLAAKSFPYLRLARSVALRLGEQGPACGDQAIGVLLGHLEDAILSDGDTPARESLDRADPWWSLDADVGRFRRRQFFRLSTLDRFAMDSPLEGGVRSEPVSEIQVYSGRFWRGVSWFLAPKITKNRNPGS